MAAFNAKTAVLMIDGMLISGDGPPQIPVDEEASNELDWIAVLKTVTPAHNLVKRHLTTLAITIYVDKEDF